MKSNQNPSFAAPACAPKVFMLVHGAWHGAWVWDEVARHLRGLGHTVYTPTLTGLGDRAAELSLSITLNTFIDDIETAILRPLSAPALAPNDGNQPGNWVPAVSSDDDDCNKTNAIEPNSDPSEARPSVIKQTGGTGNPDALANVILVGHSFAGLVITGVADRIGHRLDRLIYLDAFVLPADQSTFDTLPDKVVDALTASAQTHHGYGIPAPDPIHLGVPADTDQYTAARAKLTPHPINTYASALSLNAPIGAGVKKIYLACTAPAYKPVAATHTWVQTQPDWFWQELGCSHSAPLMAPALVADKLLSLSSL
ncbi:MAG: alpha/beta hydrolase [Advenella sp.]|uniref:alpha/beta hydrolase n=1 Tax=Advenella sp. S44 TaxID=1982755 RepID=UPI000C2A928E|nr:alpha/beta hydrolase [Advenella sp. S44]